MAVGEMQVTVIGNLTDDPELRFTPGGQAVAALTVAVNPRTFNRESGKWEDGEPSYVRVAVWRELAEHAAESLSKGMRVIVVGRFREERWEDKETKQPRSGWKLTADAIGPDLTFATATVKKATRNARGDVAPDDPWASASKTRPEPVGAGAGAPVGDEPPF